jgi:hypothetical protein
LVIPEKIFQKTSPKNDTKVWDLKKIKKIDYFVWLQKFKNRCLGKKANVEAQTNAARVTQQKSDIQGFTESRTT